MSTVYGNIGHCIGTLYKMLSPCQLTSDDLATETNALAHYCHRLTGKKSKQPNLPRPYCLVIGIKQLPPLFSVCPQHCYHCSVMLLHRIPRQAGSFGDGRELRDLWVEAHIVPQLALLFCQFFWRGDARKLLLEIFAFLVHLRDQRLEFFLALLAGVGVDITGMLCPIRPHGRITPLKQVVIDLRDASGSRLSPLPHICRK